MALLKHTPVITPGPLEADINLQRTVNSELEDGERLLWCGRPQASRSFCLGMLIWLFAIPWTAFSLFWMVMASGGAREMSGSGSGILSYAFPLFGLPFVLIGFGMLSAPFWMYRSSLRTVYGITNKRVLIIEAGKTKTVKSFTNEDIGNIKRTERADGSGDLTFAQQHGRDSDGDRTTTDITFVGIPRVRAVEQILRETFKQE